MSSLPFLEESFDTRVAPGLKSRPTVPGRTKRYSPTGVLTQNYAAAFPIHRFDAAPIIRTPEAFQAAIDLWYIVHFGEGGPYSGFRARDWRDYRLTQANSRLTFVSTGIYQINRVHRIGSVEFLRPIYKPATGVLTKRTRSGTVSTATATVDTETGLATVSGHMSGDTYTAEGLFDLPVTFSEDEWDAEIIRDPDGLLVVSGTIALEEIRLPEEITS